MISKVENTASSLFALERRISHLYASSYRSSLEHWTLLDTVRHANMWKMSCLEKVRQRLENREAHFHTELEFLEIDSEIYIVTSNEDLEHTETFLDQVKDLAKLIFKRVKGQGGGRGLCPTGFEGDLGSYLAYTLVQMPMRRYLHYSIRNDQYSLFRDLASYIGKHSRLFSTENVFDLSIYHEPSCDPAVLGRKGKWEDDELYREITRSTLVSLSTRR